MWVCEGMEGFRETSRNGGREAVDGGTGEFLAVYRDDSEQIPGRDGQESDAGSEVERRQGSGADSGSRRAARTEGDFCYSAVGEHSGRVSFTNMNATSGHG
ncbi:hypothetical protein ARMSODRAFT_799233 [Armillaria solidipes]|uniref:Uncharacterized protein n=1 Tax=Armillaria solidipes TaxID=1076256 RepID=A0A2H3AKP6_9AGAR|nr:hypothetical protein ARMSODRAFT_799233 [Armillaria solidipes]